MVLGILMINVT